jgi:hypothetical protein
LLAGVVIADVASEFKTAKIDPDIIDKVPNELIDVLLTTYILI